MSKIEFIRDVFSIIIITYTISISQTTAILQQGLNGYTGCEDAFLQIDNGGYGNYNFLTFEECPSWGPTHFHRVVIRFDCSDIPSHARVTSAYLSLTGNEFAGYGQANVCIYTLDQTWKENEVSWTSATNNSSWQNPGGDYTNLVLKQQEGFNSTKTFNFDVTSAVGNFVKNPSSNNGFVLIPERIADIVYHFKSKEHSDNSDRPKLTITYDLQSNLADPIKSKNSRPIHLSYSNQILKLIGLVDGTYQINIFTLKGENLCNKEIKVFNNSFSDKIKYPKGSFIVNIKGNHINQSKLLVVK